MSRCINLLEAFYNTRPWPIHEDIKKLCTLIVLLYYIHYQFNMQNYRNSGCPCAHFPRQTSRRAQEFFIILNIWREGDRKIRGINCELLHEIFTSVGKKSRAIKVTALTTTLHSFRGQDPNRLCKLYCKAQIRSWFAGFLHVCLGVGIAVIVLRTIKTYFDSSATKFVLGNIFSVDIYWTEILVSIRNYLRLYFFTGN